MKKFYNEKDLAEFLNVNKQYLDEKIMDFIGTQGSEIFESEDKITNIDDFKYQGFKINNYTVYVATILIDKEEDEWKQIYCVDNLRINNY